MSPFPWPCLNRADADGDQGEGAASSGSMRAASRRPPIIPELAFFRTWLDRGLRRRDGVPASLGRAPRRRPPRPPVRADRHRHRHCLQHRPAVLDRVRRSRSRAHRALRVGRRLSRRDRRSGSRRCWRGCATRPPEPFEARAYVDTGPVQERVYAQHAGLGWIGKNTCVINPELGSWIFLAEIICSLPLDGRRAVARSVRHVHAVPRGVSDAGDRRAGRARLDALHLVSDDRARAARFPRRFGRASARTCTAATCARKCVRGTSARRSPPIRRGSRGPAWDMRTVAELGRCDATTSCGLRCAGSPMRAHEARRSPPQPVRRARQPGRAKTCRRQTFDAAQPAGDCRSAAPRYHPEGMPSPSSLAPALLLSMPQLIDPNFNRTVVLLCKHNDEGAFGLVVNRPLVTTGRVVVNLDPPVSTDRELQVWVGGPVEPHRSWILVGQEPDEADELGGMRVADGLFLSTSPDLLRRLLEPSPPGDRAADRRLFRLGPGSARSRARGVGVADERRRSRSDLQHAARADVGSRHSAPRRRSGRAADVTRRALSGREGVTGLRMNLPIRR